MSYTVTNTFATQSGNVPASQLDTNFTNVLSGVNNAFLVGTLAARPAPDGVGNGRYYFATDSNGGTLYRDNGSAWVAVAAGVTLSGAQFANQSANVVFAGPSSGAAAAPTFRALVQADIGAIIGTGQLKTATGSASSAGGIGVIMNDYSFFPSISTTVNNDPIDAFGGIADPNSTLGRFSITPTGGGTVTARWRYITATDHPHIYLALKAGLLTGCWCADDPPGGGQSGLIAQDATQVIISLTLSQLDVSKAPSAAVMAAEEWITWQQYDAAHVNYRIVQQWAQGNCVDSPASWLLQHGTWDAVAQMLRVA